MLTEGGITIVGAIDTVQAMVSPACAAALQQARAAIESGQPLSTAFEANGLTTPISLRMLRVGERTGDMGPMLTQSAAFYDGEISRWIDRFTRTFEPLLMAAIGLVVGRHRGAAVHADLRSGRRHVMNAASPPAPSIPRCWRARAPQRARNRSARLVDELEALTGIEPRQLVARAGAPVRPGRAGNGRHAGARARPSTCCRCRRRWRATACCCASADGQLIGVIADPFDLDLQTWLRRAARATPRAPLHLRLALQADIQAYLSQAGRIGARRRHAAPGAADGRRDGKTAAVLSFASVSEAASPAVKLVNSTLYDALKAGASDIHLESTAGGLAVKYRVDGVLDHATSRQRHRSGRAHHLAPEGAGRTRYRRAPRAAGRQLPGRGGRARDRFARLDHAQHPWRGCRHPHPRQARHDRSLRRADAGSAGLRRAVAGDPARAGAGSLRHAAGDRARPARARPPRCTRR